MKVGIYGLNTPENVGGGFVFFNDLVNESLRLAGKHQFVLVGSAADTPARIAPQTATRLSRCVPRQLARLVRAYRAQRLRAEVEHQGIDMMWYLHARAHDVGLPYMISILDVEYRLFPWFPEHNVGNEWEYREEFTRSATQRAAIVVTGSDAVRDQVHNFFGVPLARIAVVPFPVPRAALDAATASEDVVSSEIARVRAKYGIDRNFLYYPAQFWAHKNHVNLLHALKLLRERDGVELGVAFTGADHGNLAHVRATAGRLGLDPFVHILGFVPRADVIALYRAAFALVFVSFHGPENLPVLEAQTLGCPAVLADIPGVRALYGEAPILVNPRDENAIAAGIKLLHDSPALRSTSIAKGRDFARAYTFERYVSAINRALDEFEPIRRCWP